LSGQQSYNKVSLRYRGWHDAVSLRIGRAKSCYTGRCGCILYMSLPGATTSSLERLGQSFSTSVHHDIGLPYIHLRAVRPPTYSTLFYLNLRPPLSGSPTTIYQLIEIVEKCQWEVYAKSIDLFRILFIQKYCYEIGSQNCVIFE